MTQNAPQGGKEISREFERSHHAQTPRPHRERTPPRRQGGHLRVLRPDQSQVQRGTRQRGRCPAGGVRDVQGQTPSLRQLPAGRRGPLPAEQRQRRRRVQRGRRLPGDEGRGRTSARRLGPGQQPTRHLRGWCRSRRGADDLRHRPQARGRGQASVVPLPGRAPRTASQPREGPACLGLRGLTGKHTTYQKADCALHVGFSIFLNQLRKKF